MLRKSFAETQEMLKPECGKVNLSRSQTRVVKHSKYGWILTSDNLHSDLPPISKIGEKVAMLVIMEIGEKVTKVSDSEIIRYSCCLTFVTSNFLKNIITLNWDTDLWVALK